MKTHHRLDDEYQKNVTVWKPWGRRVYTEAVRTWCSCGWHSNWYATRGPTNQDAESKAYDDWVRHAREESE